MSAAQPPKPKDSVRQRKANPAAAVQKHIPLAEIKHDTVVLKNGGIRAVLAIESMNFSLKSEDEQQAIIGSYQQFVNSVVFPIQIVIRSTKLDIDAYIADLKQRAGKQQSPLLKEQTLDYAEFIDRLIETSDIMQKRFYVVVPMDPPGNVKISFLQKYLGWLSPGDSRERALTRVRQFEEMSVKLRDRVNLVQAGLGAVGLASERMTTTQLIEFYYQIYNPGTSREQRLPGGKDLNVKEYML